MAKQKISRREFLQLSGIAAAASLLSACGQKIVKETQIVTQVIKQTEVVNQTQVVVQTQVVKETQVVNQTQVVQQQVMVTPTPLPALTTPQGKQLPADAAPLEKQIYREAGAEPKYFDGSRSIYDAGGINMITEPLLRNDENIQTVPALAESWKPGPNAEYWEFVIRQGAIWSDDDSAITADDVVFTYQHMADPTLANPWIWFYFDIKGVSEYNAGTAGPEGIGVEKVDDRTVRIYGEHGSIPYLPALLSYQGAVLAPKHVAEANPEHWADASTADAIAKLPSSGPYLLSKWDHNKEIQYVINPKYNGPHKAGIQTVINPLLATGAPEFTPWLNQETDLVHIVDAPSLAASRADPKLNPLLHFFNNFQSTYVSLNTYMPPLDNLNFRKALAHSVDRDTMCQQVLNGTYVAGYSMLPPGFPAYNPDLKQYQVYDMDQTKKYLTDSGVDPKSVTIEMYTNGRDVILEFVQQQWQTNLGIKVNLTLLDNATWNTKRAAHEMMAYRGPYEYDFVDPSNMLTSLWRSVPAPQGQKEPWGSPRHPWKSDQFDQLVTAAGSEADATKRIQEFQDAEKILVDDVGGVFLAHQVVFQIWWPWLVGMAPNKEGNVVFRWLDIARYQMYIRNDVDELKANYFK